MSTQTRTVKVSNVSLSASEYDMKEFFSFSGEIEYVGMHSYNERSQVAYVIFKDPQGAETAVLLSGATIVDQSVTIVLDPEYTLPADVAALARAQQNNTATDDTTTAQKAEDVVSSMLARGFILGKDALNQAKAFDEKLQFTSTATAKVASLDQKIGLTDKISAGTTIVNDKVRDLDQKYQVSEKTKSAFAAAEQTIMKNRYVLTGASWVTGAFNRVAKVAEDVGQKTKEKVLAEEKREAENSGYSQIHQSESPKAASSEQILNPQLLQGLIL